jgi:hypothetical protein
MLISQHIKIFLDNSTHADLAALYSKAMECQIIVAKDGGDKIESDFKGRSGDSFTDGVTKWYPIRIPKHAYSNPEDNDRELYYDLASHALGIGMTGWNWIERKSVWVGYDFDAITGHAETHTKKLTDSELKEIEVLVSNIPYVTVRRSTSGNGRHLYIFTAPIETKNHNEHKALARYILGKLSAEVGFDFQLKVDALGGVLWQWHRKMVGTNGLELISRGEILEDIPPNWKEHIPVITGRRKKSLPAFIEEQNVSEAEKEFLELTSQRVRVPFDENHKKLISYLQENGYACIYNQDHHLITTHTHALKRAHDDLNYKGVFETLARGTEHGDHNCFAFPRSNGAWEVKRFSPGIEEANTWIQDKAGWTSCRLNADPDLGTACKTYSGLEDTKGGYVFNNLEQAAQAALLLGTHIDFPAWASTKKTILKKHKDGRLLVKIDFDPKKDAERSGIPGFQIEDKYWCKLYNTRLHTPEENETVNFDDSIRHLLTPVGSDAGWTIRVNNFWQDEPLTHVTRVLKSLGYNHTEAEIIEGKCIRRSWRLVNKPFQPEYTGDREWNRNSVQLRYAPLESRENLHYPTWLSLLNHLGKSLDVSVQSHPWCKENNVLTGADYLKCWIASLFQYPDKKLPYLFFYGEENTGKSTFHEALSLLMTGGVQRAETALTSPGSFNGELENAVLCVVEDKGEFQLKKNKLAHGRIKDWVTSPEIQIHPKNKQPYNVPNYSHWSQSSNSADACPVFPGDTRITVIYVDKLEKIIPPNVFKGLLEKEAQHFITEMLHLELPPPSSRLNVPIIETDEKIQLQEYNLDALQVFVKENVFMSKEK